MRHSCNIRSCNLLINELLCRPYCTKISTSKAKHYVSFNTFFCKSYPFYFPLFEIQRCEARCSRLACGQLQRYHFIYSSESAQPLKCTCKYFYEKVNNTSKMILDTREYGRYLHEKGKFLRLDRALVILLLRYKLF